MKPASPYLTLEEAAAHVRKTVRAFHAFLYRRRKAGFPVTVRRFGRQLLFKEADLDAAMSVEEAPRRRLRSAS